jgi:hypothetical protein
MIKTMEQTSQIKINEKLFLKNPEEHILGRKIINQGLLLIYPESDTSVLFHVTVCIGAPSFNLGITTGRLIVKNDSALYQPAEYESTCKIMFYFKENEIKLATVSGFGECGFGMNVYADATYKLVKKVTPKYYNNGESTNYNFRDFK